MNGSAQSIGGRRRNVVQALQVGVVLQVVCIALPLLDLWLIGSVDRHVHAAYPEWTRGEVASDRTAILLYLGAVGVAGMLSWLAALWAVRRGSHPRATVTSLFVLGMGLLVVNAGIGGGSFERIVPL